MTKKFCDICNDQIKTTDKNILSVGHMRLNITIHESHSAVKQDICNNCLVDIQIALTKRREENRKKQNA